MTFQAILELFEVVDRLSALDKLTKSQARKLSDAENELRTQSEKEARRANQRMRALEKAGLTTSNAYRRAQGFTNEILEKRRFSQAKKKISLDDLIMQFEEIIKFLSDASSTVTGEKMRLSGLDKMFPKMNKKEKASMMRFLDSATFQDLKKIIGTDIIKKAGDNIIEGAKVSDLNKLYKNFLEREEKGTLTIEQDIFTEVWDRWNK